MRDGQKRPCPAKPNGIERPTERQKVEKGRFPGAMRFRAIEKVTLIFRAGIQRRWGRFLTAKAHLAWRIYWAMGGNGPQAGSNLFPGSSRFRFIQDTPRISSMVCIT